MTVRADWFNGATTPTDEVDDIFANENPASRSIALSVDSTQDEIMDRLGRLLKSESRLADMGIECPLKQSGECNCSACPVSQLDKDSALGALCRVGQEQERAVMLSLAKTNSLLASSDGR